jgi:hypothetical protein
VIHFLWSFAVRVAGNWNWKAAILSAAGRAPIFMIATARFGWRAMSLAGAVELVFRLFSSGVFAGITQNVRNTRPIWRAFVCISILIPTTSLGLDWLVHRAVGTPNLKAGIAVSIAVSVLTALFDWYSMNRGVLIVGNDGRSFVADLMSLPSVIAGFVTAPIRFVRNARQPLESSAAD